MAQVFLSRDTRRAQLTAALLLMAYILGNTWDSMRPPCSAYADTWHFWELDAAAIPCECRSALNTILVFVNALFLAVTIIAPRTIYNYPGQFTPANRSTIPRSLLVGLPTFELEAPGAPELSQTACAICLNDFSSGELIRQLPCGHGFHASCVDDWLVVASTCPMRCHTDLWDAAHLG